MKITESNATQERNEMKESNALQESNLCCANAKKKTIQKAIQANVNIRKQCNAVHLEKRNAFQMQKAM